MDDLIGIDIEGLIELLLTMELLLLLNLEILLIKLFRLEDERSKLFDFFEVLLLELFK